MTFPYERSPHEIAAVDGEGNGVYHRQVLALSGSVQIRPALGRARDGGRYSRLEQLEHRAQMLLGVFTAKGVLPLEFKPAYSMGDLLTQHLDELEQEADRKVECCKRSALTLRGSTKSLRLCRSPPDQEGGGASCQRPSRSERMAISGWRSWEHRYPQDSVHERMISSQRPYGCLTKVVYTFLQAALEYQITQNL